MSWVLIIAAISMGFFGSPHCLGMCGGIVTAFGLSMQSVSPKKQRLLVLTYHFGRLVSYTLLGVLAGTLGAAIFAPYAQNSLPRIVIGSVLILVGLTMFGLPLMTKLEKVGLQFWQMLAPLRKKVFPMDSFGKAIFAGLLWGFLPCGLVYSAILLAIAGHNTPTAMAMMFAFGLGTLPMLLATQRVIGGLRGMIGKFRLREINGGLLLLSGIAVIIVPLVMHTQHAQHTMTESDSLSHSMPNVSHEAQTAPTDGNPTQNQHSHSR